MTAKDLVGRTSEFVAVAGDVFHSRPRVTGRGCLLTARTYFAWVHRKPELTEKGS